MTAPRGLHTLARLHGIQTAYQDNDGRRIGASSESLIATLLALGVELRDTSRIPDRVAHRRRTLWDRALPLVVVAWTPANTGLAGEAAGSARLRIPARLRDEPVRVTIGLEGGGERSAALDPASLEVKDSTEVGGASYLERTLPLPAVPTGYHDLRVQVGTGRAARRHESLLIAAPARAAGWDALPGRARRWGLFAPLYALHGGDGPATRASAAPTFRTLGRLGEEVAEAGGAVVGTLPLLAAFLDRPYEPSPYTPVSRLFWNELYVEPRERHRNDGPDGGEAGREFDARHAMAARRPILEAEARRFFEEAEPPELAAFRARNPLADDYARFRAVTEARGPWPGWPDRLRARDVRPEDHDEAVARYHLYVQYRAERQLAETAESMGDGGVSLYLDLPLGVHPDGYDVWRERSLFATRATAGAPPDPLARGGQDWGFPPLHPEASRLQRHRYFIAAIRTHLRFGGVLRIDHVMQLHRMFWIAGADAREGVYVRYPADELYAILCLESHRSRAVIVGEDLGTVPRVVRRTMRKRGISGMYVLEFELTERDDGGEGSDGESQGEADGESAEQSGAAGAPLVPKPVPARSLASIGTHDTPTFAGWWWGRDIEIRRGLGQLTEEEAMDELRGRGVMRRKLVAGLGIDASGAGADSEAAASRVQEALLRRMGRSEAGLVLATMEDLWLEREPQNVPGTVSERNWRQRAARPLEALKEPPVARLVEALNESRERDA